MQIYSELLPLSFNYPLSDYSRRNYHITALSIEELQYSYSTVQSSRMGSHVEIVDAWLAFLKSLNEFSFYVDHIIRQGVVDYETIFTILRMFIVNILIELTPFLPY